MEKLCALRKFGSKLHVWLLVLIVVFAFFPVTAFSEVAGSGNDEAGRKLFTGETSFSSGGPPGMSCHNVGVGALGGGSLGPDLTKVWATKSYLIKMKKREWNLMRQWQRSFLAPMNLLKSLI